MVGAISGYYGGWLDTILMRFVDLMLAFPAIFLLLILFAMYGSSVLSVVVFLGVFSWMWLARVIRGEFMSLKQRDFVEAARAIGVPDGTIIRRHLLPNVAAAIIVATTLNVAYAMLSEATLSFLGFGVPPETPTWGNMLNAARPYFVTVPTPGDRSRPDADHRRAGHQLRRRRPARRLRPPRPEALTTVSPRHYCCHSSTHCHSATLCHPDEGGISVQVQPSYHRGITHDPAHRNRRLLARDRP